MQTTGTQIMTSPSGQQCMTWETAWAVAQAFRAMGLFSDVQTDEVGFDSGCWCVRLWSVNARAGNRNLHTIYLPPADEREYKLVAKIATKKATDRDRETYARIQARRAVDQE